MTSLNPSFTIGDQIIETILRHAAERAQGTGARDRAAAPRPHPLARNAASTNNPHKLSAACASA